MEIKVRELSNGVKIPVVGFGHLKQKLMTSSQQRVMVTKKVSMKN